MDMSFPLTLTLSPEGRGDAWGGCCATGRAVRLRWLSDASGGDIFAKMKAGAGSCG
jgi:hypothetical protein